MQVHDRERSGQPRVTKGQVFELVFSNIKCVFLNQFDLSIPKMPFLFLCEMQKCSKLQFKDDAINGHSFGAIPMFAENRYINLKFGMAVVQVRLYSIPTFRFFLLNFEKFGFWQKIKKVFVFIFGCEKSRLGKSKMVILKKSFDVFNLILL